MVDKVVISKDKVVITYTNRRCFVVSGSQARNLFMQCWLTVLYGEF